METGFSQLKKCRLPVVSLALAALLSGCGVLEPQYEAQEREALQQVARGRGITAVSEPRSGEAGFRERLALHLPGADAAPDDYLRFALLNHPRVQAAFYRWWAQTEAITPARSLPDPVLTFQADITDMLMSLMPGLMLDIPGWGKLEAAGKEAAAMAQVAYREYLLALHETAAQLRIAWAQLHYAQQRLALEEQTLQALGQSVAVAAAQYGTGSAGGMGGSSLQAQSTRMGEADAARTELEDSRDALAVARARFKSALGLHVADADPHWPQAAFPAAAEATVEALWAHALEQSPRLNVLRALAQTALAQEAVAERAGNPDFALGLMVDVKTNPVMFRPEAGMTLPIWRDKIAAIEASAQAGSLAAQATLDDAELELAAELASVLAALRGSERRLRYLDEQALPNVERSLAAADAGYRSGDGDFGALVELRLMALGLRKALAQAELEHALALTELALLVALPLPDEGLVAVHRDSGESAQAK